MATTRQFNSSTRVAMFATMLAASALAHGAPANDNFQNAAILSVSDGSLADSNVLATAETGEPSHGGPYSPAGKSLWWSYTPAVTSTVNFTTMGSNFDTVLAIYTGTELQTLTTVAASDDIDDGNSCSSVILDVVAGTIYYIAVDGWLARSGDIVFSHSTLATAVTAPANDFFANAQELPGNAGNLTASNVDGSKEIGEPDHVGVFGGRSVWYNYTASADGDISIDTMGSSFYTLLAVYTGPNVASLTLVASNRNPGSGFGSVVNFTGSAGTVYRVAVDGFDQQSGPFNLAYNGPVTPARAVVSNDNFQNAAMLSASDGSLVDSNVLATAETGEPSHGGPYSPAGKSLWWSYTPAVTSTVNFTTMGSNFDTVLAIYTGTELQTLTTVAASDDIDDGNSCSSVILDVVAGTTYYIAVDGWLARSGDIVFSHSTLATAVAGPANDFFANAQELSGNAGNLTASNVDASKEIGEPDHVGVFGGRSVWYNYTASANGNISIDTMGSSFNTLLAVYTGPDVASLALVASNRNPGSGFGSVVNFTGSAGTVYRVAVDGFDQQFGSFNLAYNGASPAATADVSVKMTTNRSFASASSPLVYTLAVHNNGPSAATGVVVSNVMPGEVTFITAGLLNNAPCRVAGSLLDWDLGTLGTDETLTVTVTTNVSQDAVGVIDSLASVSAAELDANAHNNLAVVSVPVVTATSGLVASWISGPVQKQTIRKSATQSKLKGQLAVTNLSPLATSPTSINFYSSVDNVLDADDTAVGTYQLKALKPGKKAKANVRIVMPLNSSATGLYIIAGVEDAALAGTSTLVVSGPVQ